MIVDIHLLIPYESQTYFDVGQIKLDKPKSKIKAHSRQLDCQSRSTAPCCYIDSTTKKRSKSSKPQMKSNLKDFRSAIQRFKAPKQCWNSQKSKLVSSKSIDQLIVVTSLILELVIITFELRMTELDIVRVDFSNRFLKMSKIKFTR